MSLWSSIAGKKLNTKPDNREEAKDYDKVAIGVYRGDLLVAHVPIEISSLCYHFLNNNECYCHWETKLIGWSCCSSEIIFSNKRQKIC